MQSLLVTRAETVHGAGPLAARPETTPSLAGPHEETLEIKKKTDRLKQYIKAIEAKNMED